MSDSPVLLHQLVSAKAGDRKEKVEVRSDEGQS
jgi:hypothetical protein